MERLRSAPGRSRRFERQHGRLEHERGFALLEVITAVTVLTLTLTGISAVLATQLVSVQASTAQQTANGYLTQAMEEVRALPYQFVVDGLAASDSTILTDSNISVSGSSPNQTYTFKPTGETIPVASPYTQAPFVPHLTTKIVNGVTFSIATYPTIDTDQSGLYRVTIIVSWHPSHGVSSLSAQTLVYSPSSGCLTDTNHPFAAPCQPFFYSQSGVTNGTGITVSGFVAGLNLTKIALVGPQSSSSLQIEESSSVMGEAETSEVDLTAPGVDESSGGQGASSAADNDPGTNSGVSQTNSTADQSGANPLTLGSLLTTGLTAVAGLGDEGDTTSTVDASSSPACDDLANHAQVTGLPCGNSNVSQSGAVGSIAGELTGVSWPLASVSPSSNASFVGRYTNSGGLYCGGTSGDGCVHAAASRRFGTIELAGLPALPGFSDPAGWGAGSTHCPAGNYLVGLVGYSDQVTSESGVGAAVPSVSGGTSYLCFWNGSTYQAVSVSLGSSPAAVSIPTLTVGIPSLAAVTITPSISFGQSTTTQTSPTGCASACTASSEITSPISGSLEISIVVLGVTVADVTIAINLGTANVRTSYQAAP